jgi:hypothetical protein
MINIELKTAKKAAEIIQDKEQAFNYLNLNAAINQAAREFSERGNKVEDLKRAIREIVH